VGAITIFSIFAAMKIFISHLTWMLLISVFVKCQFKTDSLLEKILQSDTSSILGKLIQQPDKYRVQIIYTQIDRDAGNEPGFRNYYFHVGKDYYYYPASTVKLPLALLSLEKLNRMHKTGLDKFTRMEYDSSYSGQKILVRDSSSETGYPSIAQFIRKAFLISDNDAYNRMYEFVGQEEINRGLHSKGFADTRILRQFMPLTELENRYTNQIRFLDSAGKLIYVQPPAYNKDSFQFFPVVKIGNGYLNARDSLIGEPMDFTRHNRIPLEDLQQILQTALFPLSVPELKRFNLQPADYAFLYQYLSQYPSETPYPKYDTAEFYDSYVKFYFQKGGRQLPEYIRVFNKVGWAYGFLTDVSYIVDFKNHIEFMISATVYANEDGILNDDKYEYDSIALPFLYRVGQDIYRFDLKRKRKFKPDLRNFQMKYDHRDPADPRTSIKDVDN
jgi:Beta-lactamase enzyme family